MVFGLKDILCFSESIRQFTQLTFILLSVLSVLQVFTFRFIAVITSTFKWLKCKKKMRSSVTYDTLCCCHWTGDTENSSDQTFSGRQFWIYIYVCRSQKSEVTQFRGWMCKYLLMLIFFVYKMLGIYYLMYIFTVLSSVLP